MSNRERKSEFMTVVSNIPDVLCVSKHGVSHSLILTHTKQETTTANRSYVKHACVSEHCCLFEGMKVHFLFWVCQRLNLDWDVDNKTSYWRSNKLCKNTKSL